jgi:multicomponent Na+:H+ antiporter subunit C
MELVLATTVGVMFAAGTYLILKPSFIRIVMGFGLYSNAANLLLMACGGFQTDWHAPFVPDGAPATGLMDPLPPDIILTAIVINFAVGALLLTLCYRVYVDHGTDDPAQLASAAGVDGSSR